MPFTNTPTFLTWDCLVEHGYHLVDGWQTPYSWVRHIQEATVGRLVTSAGPPVRAPLLLCLFIFLSYSSFLYFVPPSSYIIITLSLSLPPSPGLLHNVQLYLLQLRILIFPTRQNARANQERREEELGKMTFLTWLCALPR